MRYPSPHWSRSRLYSAAGLGFAVLAGVGVLAIQSVAGGRALYASLWVVIGALLVLGGWLFGRQEDRLRHISVTDGLTGLTNRREFERRLEEELDRADRHGLPLSLVLLDVDLLKAINDRSGHRAGDRALCAVADALRSSCRSVDIAARVGGDEFAILAPTTSARDALQLATRVQTALRERPAGAAPLSISIGVADVASASARGERDLLEAADRALYRAKSGGRDRIALGADVESDAPGAAVGAAGAVASGELAASPPPLRLVPGGKS
ncbi:MAG TPA: diguanylate cyclase [Kofleriaceae bacterium]|nr:diguanylate cyclase [Kofleriaceae bacterium]